MIEGEAPEPSSEVRKVPTQRQMEVLRLLAQGRTYKEVADEMCIVTHSVKQHATNAYDRLGVHSNVQAFIALGWLKVP